MHGLDLCLQKEAINQFIKILKKIKLGIMLLGGVFIYK